MKQQSEIYTMPRWNNSQKDNCIHIMDNVIRNLKPNLRESILNEIESSNNINSKVDIERYIRNKLGLFTSNARHTRQYWILRGWDNNEAYVKAKENKNKNSKSVYGREFWLERINPVTSKLYTIEEADFERNSRRPIRKEYWIKKGHTDFESIELAQQVKRSNDKKGSKKASNSDTRRITSKRCLEYYTVRGYSKQEAEKLVSDGQIYFSKEICIEKHGEVKGLQIWQDRQDRWQETLKSKPPEEIARINKLKLFKGGSISKGELQLYEELRNQKIHCSNQHAIQKNNTSYYVYDISFQNKIIEYNGDFWHSNPAKYPPDYVNRVTELKASDQWKKDQEKIEFAQKQGYEVLVVWESEFKKDKEEILQKCIKFLTQ